MLAIIQAGYKHREANKCQLYFQIFSVCMQACVLFRFYTVNIRVIAAEKQFLLLIR